MKKRILSFLLVAVMLVGAVFATGAFAADGELYPDVPGDHRSVELCKSDPRRLPS